MSVAVAAYGAGKAVATIAAGKWMTGRAERASASAELIDLIKTGFPDDLMRRKTVHQFEALAMAVEERLTPYTRQEMRGLDDGTREAALREVIRTLGAADLSDEALFADDADPVRLARRLRAALPRREAELELGEAGARLYEVVLDECCDCLAHILVHLPEFGGRAAAESLKRLSDVIGSLETILSRLPARTLDAPEGDSFDDEFTRRYLHAVSESLDRLELFGVRLERLTRPRTTLSVAYISLNVTDESPSQENRGPIPIDEWREVNYGGGTVRVERALGAYRLMLIRGEAGSGKSTLLRWLAVTAARSAFTEDLAPLNGYVPLLIKLRSHAGRGLPRPEEFLDDVAGTLSGVMPRGWVHRRLASGRALLLVDGIDELVESERYEVLDWLGELTRIYSRVRAVVTSRPAASEADWLKEEEFRTAFLQPLTPADLTELVRHWHAAIRDSDGLPCEPERLPAYEAKLLARFESSPHLRTLATTPLLAAMLCALNLDRDTLPPNRMGLYASAIDMLLEARDDRRGIPSAKLVQLDRDQKVRILRELAWHLSLSDRVELPKSTAQRLTAERVEAMPQVRAMGEEALDALLQRSGLIREPVPGRVDFVHRTIQEYLTAAHAAYIGDMDLLVRNAHLDQWRETIIMAAGHANESQQLELIEGVLARAQKEGETSRKLKLLACGCLETLPEVSGSLRIALEGCLRELVPPVGTDEAVSLAAIGEPVLQWLPENLEGLPDHVARAVVRTAWLVNGEGALNFLRRYADGSRPDVWGQLTIAWEYFDPGEYAKRVLAAVPPEWSLIVRSHAQFAVLSSVSPLSNLELSGVRPIDLSPLSAHGPSLRRLVINCENVEDYSPLRRLTGLQTLSLSNFDFLRGADQLPPLAEVRELYLADSRADRGRDVLADLARAAPKLVHLSLSGCGWVDDLVPLTTLSALNDLVIPEIAPGTDLSPLARIKNLKRVHISADQDVRGADTISDRLHVDRE